MAAVVSIEAARRRRTKTPRPPWRVPFSEAVKTVVNSIQITPIADEADRNFVVQMKRVYAERNGLPYVAWDNALYFVAKHVVTDERFGCMAVNKLAPLGHYFVGDFFVVDGRRGKIAILAMLEALHGSDLPVMGLVANTNGRMKRALELYGYTSQATLYQREPGKGRT